jgi:RHS repeat-associated protein
MRVIQERNINGVPTVAYTRGPDLSGTLEGAGGIGGLLARSEWDGSAWSRHAFYHSDGVGNVTALAVPNGNAIALAGSYRYDPFGRLIGTPTGLAAINTQRFSSKDWHNLSGFYYFGYRFYDPATQRWLNRDPIAEEGGVNLYGYVENDPINWVDVDGLAAWRLEGGHGGWQFQLGDSRWDAQTLRPVEHLGNTPTSLTPGQLEEIRKAGLLDKAGKLFPEGVVAREAAAAGLTAGRMLKLSKNLAKPLCKTLGRVTGPLTVVGAVSDVKAIGQTAVTGAQAASAAGNALSSTLETQSKMNNQRLMNGDDLSDDEITHWMSHRIGR